MFGNTGFGQQSTFNKPSGGGGLFGSSNNQTNTGRGGLFGSNTNNQFKMGGGLNQNKPNAFGMSNTQNTFGVSNQNKSPFGGGGSNFGTTQNNAFGGGNTGGGLFGNTQNQTTFGTNNLGMNQNNNTGGIFGNTQKTGGFGMGNNMGGNRLGMGNNTMGTNNFVNTPGIQQNQLGTTFKPFGNIKNTKGQDVKTITYQKEYNSIPLVNLRLEDYMLFKQNKLNNQNIQSAFQNYERVQSGSAPMNTMGLGGQNTFGMQNQQKNLFGQSNQINTNQNQFGQKQTTGGLFGTTPQNPNQFNFNKQQQSNNLMNLNPTGLTTSNVISNKAIPLGYAPTQQKPGGLFSNTQTNTNTGGLFGSNTQTRPNPGGGLFGNTQTNPNTGGLFGNNTQTRPNPSGGLFGNTQTNQSNTQVGMGGLFTKPQTNFPTTQNTGGLFGSNTQTTNTFAKPSGGLFGNTQNQTQNTGGLFGNKPTTQTGGLFGNKPTTQTGGLFGNKPTTQTGGLFGNSQGQSGGGLFNKPQTTQPGLFGNNARGNQNGGLFNKPSNVNMQSGLFNRPNVPQGNQMAQSMPVMMNGNINGPYAVVYLPFKDGKMPEMLSNFQKSDGGVRSNFAKREKRVRHSYERDFEEEFYEEPKLENVRVGGKYRKYLEAKNKLESRIFQKKKLDRLKKKKKMSGSYKETSFYIKEAPKKFEDDSNKIFLTIEFNKGSEENKKITVKFDKDDILGKIVNFVYKNFQIEKNQMRDIKLLYGGQELDNCYLLSDYGIQEGDTIIANLDFENKMKLNLPNKTILPLKSKKFKTKPNYEKLCRMTEQQLSEIENFKIFNEFGSICFLGKTNVTNLDIDKIIQIKNKQIEVYPEEFFEEDEKPEVGDELNKRAVLTLNQLRPQKDVSYKKFLKKLKSIVEGMKAKFLDYDRDEGQLVLKVEHF